MKISKKTKQTFGLFIVTFFVSLIIITYFIKSMSPDVDVEIGGQEDYIEQTDSDSDVKQAIDERLRWIQMEDNMPNSMRREDGSIEEIQYEHEEIVKKSVQEKDKNQDKEKLKKQQNPEKTIKEQTLEAIEYVAPQPQKAVPPTPKAISQQQTEPFRMSKVYVGSYPTIEQAIQAQNKLMNTNISVSPFVKEVNGHYVLQAGSYANASKAEAVAQEISSAGFAARVVKE